MAKQPQSPVANLQYVDRPEVSEVFADALHSIVFDGSSLRLEFAVARFDEPKPSKERSGRKVTACRLVLSPNGLLELSNKLQGMITVLEKRGVLHRAQSQ
jgi:hypothetical protein